MECRMDGRVALITGGSRGLGRAMAETVLKAGAQVAIVARRPDVLQEAVQDITAASDGAIKGYAGDVGKAADCQRVVDAAVADLGPIDILRYSGEQCRHIRTWPVPRAHGRRLAGGL